MLKVRRIENVITNEIIGNSLLKDIKFDPNSFKIVPNILFSQSLHFIMAKNHPKKDKLLNKINAAKKKLKNTGKYQRILRFQR